MEEIQAIKMVKISELLPHPKNNEIYGDEDVSDLVEKIKKYGLLASAPIVITETYVIISGHRRVKACKQLGIKKIGAIINTYDSKEQEIEELVNLNLTRDRTPEQKGREALTLIEVDKNKAEKRRMSNLNNQNVEVPDSALRVETGKTRDIIAQKIGFKSGHEAERTINTVKKIDELKARGDKESKEKAEILSGVLNKRNASAADTLAKRIDNIKIPDDKKDDIKLGKISPEAIIRESETGTKICEKCKHELPLSNFRQGRNKCIDCVNEETSQKSKEKRYMTDITGKKMVIDDSLLADVDLDAIERSIKGESTNEYIIDHNAEMMEFEANTMSYIIMNTKFIDNVKIFEDMPDDIKLRFLYQIEQMEKLLQNIKNNIN